MTPEEIAAAKKLADEAAAKKLEDEAAAAAKKLADDALANLRPEDADMIAKLVAKQVEEQLKDTKEKLNSAYDARDKAQKRADALDKKEREAELKLLEEAGKHKEAFDIRIAEANTKYETLLAEHNKLKADNTELARDAQVRDLLRATEFKSDKAASMGFKDISAELIRNDQNQWVHRSGISIKDFITAFVSDEANAFLFKVKQSSGSGTTPTSGVPPKTSTSLFAKSQADVIKLAMEGKLPSRKN